MLKICANAYSESFGGGGWGGTTMPDVGIKLDGFVLRVVILEGCYACATSLRPLLFERVVWKTTVRMHHWCSL